MESDSLCSANKPAGGVRSSKIPAAGAAVSRRQLPRLTGRAIKSWRLVTWWHPGPSSLTSVCPGTVCVTGHNSPDFAAWHLHDLLLLTREGQHFLGIQHEPCSVLDAELALSISPLVFLGTSGRASQGLELFTVLRTWCWQQTRAVVVEIPCCWGLCQPEARRQRKLG